METIDLGHPGWRTTFPHWVTPFQNEWFPGLLLRCDEANHWKSKRTLSSLMLPSRKQYPTDASLFIVSPDILDLEYLTQALAVSMSDLLAITYHVELSRLYGTDDPRAWHLYSSILFHLCPECLTQNRMLQRFLALPHITLCPHHQIDLLQACRCGTPLKLFNQQTPPFTCSLCHLDWAQLPRVKSVPEQIAMEQKYLSFYEFVFSHGSPQMLQCMLACAYERQSSSPGVYPFPQKTWSEQLDRAHRAMQRPMSLGALVHLLVSFDIHSDDIVSRL